VAEKLTISQVAERLGIAPSTWRGYVSREQAPRADGQFDRRTPWWWDTTIDNWKRPGPGTRTDLKDL
jgi:hypothetical protein